jgi:LytS/YehU family sensor histidine kinase
MKPFYLIATRYSPLKLLLISLISALVIIYPNIACLPWELGFLDSAARVGHLHYFVFRYLFFVVLIGLLGWSNLRRMGTPSFGKRFAYNLLITLAAYALYVAASLIFFRKGDCFGSILLFQFVVMCLLTTFVGYIAQLYSERTARQQEIEQLKMENLQSRYDALTNQINPHFLFNSLNGLTALIRKEQEERKEGENGATKCCKSDAGETLEYVDKMSDIFRYILQSDRKGLVPLAEEIAFVQSFRYMMEVRFAHKLTFRIEIPDDKYRLQLPVLSLLPLIDNIMMHNIIDSRHKMEITVSMNEADELVVSNPRYPKLSPPPTNGTGLRNLENRFMLLLNRHVRIDSSDERFTVYLPLK